MTPATIIALVNGTSLRVSEPDWGSRSLSECYTCFQCYVHRQLFQPSFDMPTFEMLFEWLKDCFSIKPGIFLVISGGNDK